jgi:predicted transcriptional regulator
VELTHTEYKELTRVADEADRSKREIVRQAIETFIKQFDERKQSRSSPVETTNGR